ncbi:uncharacterized protein LOC110182945 isoform X1 [Drosophila serrata]|uniref:uncharacterized protein LOC110182945 isoform X1 n=1 Tax=Drosophila serrata TaxID=7274 RepID=UPI000A1D1282|nr:uncharacterized protein LOC110182945 isoform X1 [Drosophila serrata]
MSFRTSFLVAAGLLLLLIQEHACVAPATQETVTTIPVKSAPAGKIVKKAQPEDPSAGPKDSMVVVSKGGPEPAAPPALPPDAKAPALPVEDKAPASGSAASLPVDDVLVEHSHMNSDDDSPGQAVVYIVVGITSTAILLLVMRVYRLRLSRAERKYGVQGDRANQELTPLPMAIEDVNSDEEDHTLFEVNRQNIRIL